jgi:hypothetical protein
MGSPERGGKVELAPEVADPDTVVLVEQHACAVLCLHRTQRTDVLADSLSAGHDREEVA